MFEMQPVDEGKVRGDPEPIAGKTIPYTPSQAGLTHKSKKMYELA
jgi:hypothetical protein